MATTLSNLLFTATLRWKASKALSGGLRPLVQGPDATTFRSAPGPATFDLLMDATYTIAASGTQVVDLASFADLFGDTRTMAGVAVLLLLVTGTTGGIKLEPNSSTGLVWFFAGTTPSVTVPVGGVLAFGQAASQTVDSAHKKLLLTNTSGTDATVANICALGHS